MHGFCELIYHPEGFCRDCRRLLKLASRPASVRVPAVRMLAALRSQLPPISAVQVMSKNCRASPAPEEIRQAGEGAVDLASALPSSESPALSFKVGAVLAMMPITSAPFNVSSRPFTA